jgi:hypothetical protein
MNEIKYLKKTNLCAVKMPINAAHLSFEFFSSKIEARKFELKQRLLFSNFRTKRFE